MAEIQVYRPDNLPDMSKLFSWGLRVAKFEELYFITGLADMADDGSGARFPGNPVAQTESVLERMDQFIREAGFEREHIIRMEWTFRKDVQESDYPGIYAAWEAFVAPMKIKPAGGTLRIVDRLAAPDIMVEYELLLAR
ncbi:RidA family protein [Haliea sp. E1-2-M8]|uniref:RidA family protein n=1 Tax=Haliea sp. E1-2-M8 TaxID=3064706 RepID=UPI002719EC6D|nr:RidA family protein [Haliea sp. E1-2-M8]MDO8863031.1 RidA family protein [Haliea sp. E1-2-M8]